MTPILAFLKQTVFPGWPLYVWGIVLLLGGINEWIAQTKYTEARSLWQGLWRFVLWIPMAGPLIGRFPLLGDLARRFAGLTPVPESVAADAGPYRTPAPSCSACGQALPAVVMPPPLPPPPSPLSAAGAVLPIVLVARALFLFVRSSGFLLAAVVSLAVVGAASGVTAGCANAYAYTRSIVASIDRANGAAARLGLQKVKECGDQAVAFARAEKFAEAESQLAGCTRLQASLEKALKGSVDATGIAAAGIDGAEAIQSEDVAGLLPPLIQAAVRLKRAADDAGLKLPPILGVN